jgi:hypothetical protein
MLRKKSAVLGSGAPMSLGAQARVLCKRPHHPQINLFWWINRPFATVLPLTGESFSAFFENAQN